MKEPNNELSVYSVGDMVAIQFPASVCYVSPQVAIEMTVSLTRAALSADPSLAVEDIRDAFIPTRESVQ